MPQADPVADVLKKAPMTNAVRAAAWDLFEQSANEDEFAERVKSLALPQHVKAQLWDLKAQQSTAPTAAGEPPARELEPNTAGAFLRHAGQQLNPVTAASGLVSAAAHPVRTVKQMGAAQGALFDKAKAAYDEGDYPTAVRHFLHYLIPLAGPMLDTAADRMVEGEPAAGAGDAVGMGLAMFAPAAVASRLPKTPRPTGPITRPRQTQRLNEFAKQQDIPLDVATATGNKFARGVQRLADESFGGSVISEKAAAAQAQALTRTGESLAARTGRMATSPEGAGAAMRTGVERAVTKLDDQASAAYAQAETLAAKRTQTVQTGTKTTQTGILDASGQPITRTTPITQTFQAPINVSAAKEALRPLYDQLRREAELVPLQGGKARTLTALDRLMNGPDTVSLMTAERATGDLGALAGTVEVAGTRTAGQATAAQAFARLRRQVDDAAKQAGGDVYGALVKGRQLTKRKHAVIDTLDAIRDEPVQAFRQASYANDAGIARLREIAEAAPDTLPTIGRAWIDDALNLATSEGGFQHAAKLAANWQKLGPQTKRLLFKDPGYIADLDAFFGLAKRMAENPNPSGTALTLAKGGELGLWISSPLVGTASSLGAAAVSKFLHSPVGVKLAVLLLRTPAKATHARRLWAQLQQELGPGLVAGQAVEQAPSRGLVGAPMPSPTAERDR